MQTKIGTSLAAQAESRLGSRIFRPGGRRAGLALLLAARGLIAPVSADPALPRDSAPARMTVSVATARNACFTDILRVSGAILARDEIFVQPEAEGLQLAKVLVEDGARVKTGQPLAELVRPSWAPGAPRKATLTAPASGTLIYRAPPVGAALSPRGEPIFRIIGDGILELLVALPESALAKVRPGQEARVETLDALEFVGAVRIILPEIDPQTQLGHARIELRDASDARPGAFATAAIDLGKSCGASVPLSSILYGPQGAVAQVVRDDRVETRRVTVGLADGKNAEIREGLAEGETVVARAGAFLRDGDFVTPAP
ncbi:efflux RND transporter periplasmic adaptor subunit [Methylocapsa acidiphila]|uniref:efflux RND transporter periplasmic adaptor subunit n=1 Tax=Methylocapsa acidiphila TaxID=133552 RepID=UPI000A01A3E0|nr:efflux RND transporter periplasmic adaptor subunit [Methylocapsa acidiphila]